MRAMPVSLPGFRPGLLLALGIALSTGACDRASAPAGQGNVAAASPDEVTASGPAPAAPVVAIDRSHKGEAAPAFAFADAAGKATSLAAFRGKPVLVNLWATWCGPCVRELPTLDRLAAAGTVRVVALSQDGDAAKANAFFKARGLKALAGYTDPQMQWLGPVTTNLPTTILYDATGHELWRVAGDLDWTGSMARDALAEAR